MLNTASENQQTKSSSSTVSHIPRYPIYIPSLGRATCALTANMLQKEAIPFTLVIEPKEREAYAQHFAETSLLTLPGSDYGHPAFARNFCKQHAREKGYARHWQLDDNIKDIRRFPQKAVVCCTHAFTRIEDLVDKFENVALAGLMNSLFAWKQERPFSINQMCYCAILVDNHNPALWRYGTVEDCDYSLQILFGGKCTLLIHEYAITKTVTMTMKGGNTDTAYKGDGRLTLIRNLQRAWPPGLIGITRRFGYPKAVTSHLWRTFPQRPQLKPFQP